MPDIDALTVRQILCEFVGAYLLGDADWVRVVADQIEGTQSVHAMVAEADLWGRYLTSCSDVSDDPVSPEFIGAGIRARLAAALPPHDEMAAVAIVQRVGGSRNHWGYPPSGERPADELLLLHVMAAGLAELGSRVFGGEFTPEELEIITELAPRGRAELQCGVVSSQPNEHDLV